MLGAVTSKTTEHVGEYLDIPRVRGPPGGAPARRRRPRSAQGAMSSHAPDMNDAGRAATWAPAGRRLSRLSRPLEAANRLPDAIHSELQRRRLGKSPQLLNTRPMLGGKVRGFFHLTSNPLALESHECWN